MSEPESLFADFAETPADHFRLHFFGAVLVLIERASERAGSLEAAIEPFPFLAGYNNELAERVAGLSAAEALARWKAGLAAWEARTAAPLPLRALRELLGLDPAGVMCLLTVGLAGDDARFGLLFETLQGTPGQRRATAGLLRECWHRHVSTADFGLLLRQAHAAGVLEMPEEGAVQEPALRFAPMIWEALRGDPFGAAPWVRWRAPETLPSLEELIVTDELRAAIAALPALFEDGTARAVVVRGARHSGRRTLLAALAREMGRGVLELCDAARVDGGRWRAAHTLAVLRHALPIASAELAPGETLALPEAWPAGVPLALALGREGGLSGELAAGAVPLTLELPGPEARRAHWARSLRTAGATLVAEIARRHRLPAGRIHRAAGLARLHARLAGRDQPDETEVLEALRTLNRAALDALARRLRTEGDWSRLSASAVTLRELRHLESRCLHRERLPALLDASPSIGVRALFTGPSGTGKTHAARLLAAILQKDLYQLDLSAVVNKYIGETEKNLHRLFEAAEDLDVILLLDEGDSLLGQRTEVSNANDRYANLETNFLLQRLESYEGILIVTTNARSRIDGAFERRLDVTVEFHAPEAAERASLWAMHLPPAHAVSADFLDEAAARCELTGGQIRNATLHAALLALDRGGVLDTAGLEAAIRREYAKHGGACPLRHLAPIF